MRQRLEFTKDIAGWDCCAWYDPATDQVEMLLCDHFEEQPAAIVAEFAAFFATVDAAIKQHKAKAA